MKHSFLRLAARFAQIAMVAALVMVVGGVTACAQSPAGRDELRAEIETVKEWLKETQRQLDRLERILRHMNLPQYQAGPNANLEVQAIRGSTSVRT